jgi:hypothetical protein
LLEAEKFSKAIVAKRIVGRIKFAPTPSGEALLQKP